LTLTSEGRAAWTEEQVRGLLEREDFAYQRIELPYGLATEGEDRSPTSRLIFPEDMSGKTVLDVGCWHGFFCFEALKRGATLAVGVDVDPEAIRRARLLAECLGSSSQFRVMDIDTDPLEERFDYVLCLNLLHHLRNPIAVLDKLIEATRERLVLEVAGLGRHDRRKLGLSRIAGMAVRNAPVMFVGRQGASSQHGEQRFFMTPAAVQNFLQYQRKSFARVRTAPSGFKNRYVSLADKRRIGRLIVVAGPTSVGKSTFITKLCEGRLPTIAGSLEMDRTSVWRQVGARSLASLPNDDAEGVILHYDFLRPKFSSSKTYRRDDALGLVDMAEEVTFVTLIASADVLRRRLQEGEIRPKTQLGMYRGSNRYLKIARLYDDPASVRSLYETWFDFTRQMRGRHYLVSTEEESSLHAIEEWSGEAERLGLDPAADRGV